MTLPLVSPVPDFLRTTPRDQLSTTPRAEPNSARSGLHSFAFSERKFHTDFVDNGCQSNKVKWADVPQNRGITRTRQPVRDYGHNKTRRSTPGPLPPLRKQGFATTQLHQTGRLCPRAACHGNRRSKGRTNLPSPPVGQASGSEVFRSRNLKYRWCPSGSICPVE